MCEYYTSRMFKDLNSLLLRFKKKKKRAPSKSVDLLRNFKISSSAIQRGDPETTPGFSGSSICSDACFLSVSSLSHLQSQHQAPWAMILAFKAICHNANTKKERCGFRVLTFSYSFVFVGVSVNI